MLKELFEASPRPKAYETEEYRAKVEESGRRFLEPQEINLKIELSPGEKFRLERMSSDNKKQIFQGV